MEEYDCVIIGGGISALMCALELNKFQKKILIVSKVHPLRSSSATVSDGINYITDINDSKERFIEDTINYSKRHSKSKNQTKVDTKKITMLCENANACIDKIYSYGSFFECDEKGDYIAKKEEGHFYPRTLFCQDNTGLMIQNTLFEQILKNKIPFFYDVFVLDLVIRNYRLNGVVLYDLKLGIPKILKSKSIILADEGFCQIFDTTSCCKTSTGDVQAILYNKGMVLSNIDLFESDSYKKINYSIGGICINDSFNAVSSFDKQDKISGLFAVRDSAFFNVSNEKNISGNYLLQQVVFPTIVSKHIIDYLNTNVTVDIDESLSSYYEIMIRDIKRRNGNLKMYPIFMRLKNIMDDCFLKNKTKKTVEHAKKEISEMKNNLPFVYLDDKSLIYNTQIIEFLELKNMIDLSFAVLLSLEKRLELNEEKEHKEILIKKEEQKEEIFLGDFN